MRKRVRATAMALALGMACVLAAAAQEGPSLWPNGKGPYIGVDAFVGTPSASSDVFRSAFYGASLRFVASRNFEISLDYAFMDVGYYYPETASGPWTGPVPWSSVPERYEGMRASWIFYHTKHFLAPQLWYVAPLERYGLPLAIRLGAGPAISFLVPGESAKYYPGLSDAFELFQKDFQAYLGLSLRTGLEYRPWPWARLGIEYLFIADSFTGLATDVARYRWDYLDRAGNVVFFAGLRI